MHDVKGDGINLLTNEQIEAARALIYCHIGNEIILGAMYRALDNLQDKIKTNNLCKHALAL